MWANLRRFLWPEDSRVDFPTAISFEEPASGAAPFSAVKRTSTFTRYPPGYPDRPYLVLLRSVGVFALGLVAAWLSYRDFLAKRAEAAQTAQIQVQSLLEGLRDERTREAASLVTQIRCEQDERTKLALALLDKTAPEYAKLFSQVLQSECSQLKPEALLELRSLQYESARDELGTQFTDSLAAAWLYREYGSYHQALLSFEAAGNRIPQSYGGQVNFNELARARESSEQGRVKEAVDHYANAFRAINTQ